MTDGLDVPGGHRAPPGSPPFPGGVAVSHLRVYASAAEDGLVGGAPHCHTVCTEAYAVVRGSGRVLTLSGQGFGETPVEAGSFVWFTPGTVHRLVNDSGDLEVLVLMQNAGLPEAGDLVLTFPDDVLADPNRYGAEATLPPAAATTDADDSSMRTRRDLAVEGFTDLVAGGGSALARFHQRAAALVAPRAEGWRPIWSHGPRLAAQRTGEQLTALEGADPTHLGAASVHVLAPPPDQRRYGCCGTLGVYLPDVGPG